MSFLKQLLVGGALAFTLGCSSSAPLCERTRHTHERTSHHACLSRELDLEGMVSTHASDPEYLKRILPHLQKAKIHCIAGNVAEKLEEFPTAIEHYAKANSFESAALVAEKMGDKETAKNWYLRAYSQYVSEDCPECAFRVAEKLDDPYILSKAKINLMLRYAHCNWNADAAQIAEEMNNLPLAIKYAEAGNHLINAAALNEKAGNRERAIELYQKTGFEKDVARVAKEVAEEAEFAGKKDKAYRYYELGADALAHINSNSTPLYFRAAHCALQENAYEAAIRNAKKAGDYDLINERIIPRARRQISILAERGQLLDAAALAHTFEDEPLAELLLKYAETGESKDP